MDSDNRHSSPSALYTETVPLLLTPPQHLLDNLKIQEVLHSLSDAIKVKTPFNVNKFELLLTDHPNQPFVKSVMKGLHEGFWPFDKGEWKVELEEVIPSYDCDPNDAEAICAYCDWEITAGCWSASLENTDLLPRIKVSPMFVVWQNEKPCVVTDHSHSRINDNIPCSETKVKYNDMRTFSQMLEPQTQENAWLLSNLMLCLLSLICQLIPSFSYVKW